MKKTLHNVLYIGVFLSSTCLFAQNKVKLGLDAGYTYSSLNTNVSNLVDAKYKPRYGFGINFSAELSVWKSIFVSSGVSFLQKNYEYQRTGTREGWYTKYDNNFISAPLLIGAYILNDPKDSNGVWIKVAGGMYTEYWLSMKREGQYPIFTELQADGTFNYTKASDKYDFDKNENQLKRFGYGLQGQAQLGYAFDQFDIYAAYNYQYGLSDIKKYNISKDQKATRNSYMISAGVAYKFK
jgi:hypothetical protein